MLMKMFEMRRQGYRAIGYAQGDAQRDVLGTEEEAHVEYDEQTLGCLEEDEWGEP